MLLISFLVICQIQKEEDVLSVWTRYEKKENNKQNTDIGIVPNLHHKETNSFSSSSSEKKIFPVYYFM